MVRRSSLAAAGVALASVTFWATAAQAAAGDIPFFWNNSSDQDVKLKFVSYGDNFTMCRGGTSASVYFKWQTQSNGSGRINGAMGKNECTTYNMDFAEGHWVKAQVCEEKGGIVPDDCSAWKTGSS
jgi:hypothetical protein